MIPGRLIEKKRDGEVLPPDDLRTFLDRYLAGEVAEYQMSAFLMAVYFRGLAPAELDVLTDVMIHSGRVLDLSALPSSAIDKHSTGGVGDKVSLALAPLAAELGVCVPMMAGRGLGHTGGTLDKLESIPGFRTDLELERFVTLLERVRCAIIGQSEEIAPLDGRLYQLRDVTATVSSIPLIAASIMSKKLAEGLQGLVLDVKVGSGAFLPELERARELARTMVDLGSGRGLPTVAVLTAMDRPLGHAIGNALEAREAYACLAGGGPADLREVVATLVGEMLVLGRRAEHAVAGRERALDALERGEAVDRAARMIDGQGGDSEVVLDPDRLPRAPERLSVQASEPGVVRRVDPRELGYGVVELGGGRTRLGEDIDPRVGFTVRVGPGDAVAEGERLGTVHAATPGDAGRGAEILRGAIEIGTGDDAGRPLPLVIDRVGPGMAEGASTS